MRIIQSCSFALAALAIAWLATPAMAEEPNSQDAPQLPNSVWLEDYTSPELAWAIYQGAQVVIVPVGGTEQNGPHMTLRKHNVIVVTTAESIARTLTHTFVAPLIPISPQRPGTPDNKSNMSFAGTLSATPEHFKAFMEDYARSLKSHGFRLICLMVEHSEAIKPVQDLARRLSDEWAKDGVRVLYVSGYNDVQEKQQVAYLTKKGISPAQQGTHAGVADTSEAWAAYPPAIREKKLADHTKRGDYAETGATGDSRKASAELGKKLLSIKAAAAAAQIHRAWENLNAGQHPPATEAEPQQ